MLNVQKTVLVTGGCGFLGSWLCEHLLEDGARVICVDNLLSGRLRNIATCRQNPDFTFLRHDVVNPISIEEPVHEIYNLACAASPKRYQADPIHTFKTSVIGVMNLLISPKNTVRGSCRPRPRRCTETRIYTRRPRLISGT